MRQEIHFSLVILVTTRIAGLALTTRIEEILGGFILNSEYIDMKWIEIEVVFDRFPKGTLQKLLGGFFC